MLKKITWQDGTILSLKLRDDLYTLVQMREDYYLEFFDIKNSRDEWSDIDLGKTDILFFNFTATKALKTLAISAPPLEKVAADNRRPQRILLRAIIGGNYGADLIELTDSLEDFDATVLKSNLTLENDLETIYRYELSGIIGDPEKLRNRLINYFDNGVNWDEAKAFLFKGISPPPAKKSKP
ncbi:hypothetical protein [Pseudomonas sp. P9_31]|uniref:hypothetical protein n=1 Tax=Pseudomonas sp. P9_31 TaxID=3043448 RepID=UPI002A371D51|nr:hypothetical protein [Pseudomonas sp. P9_31]WPN57895.1 hypothetical protein QMK51_27930 [Pseudomonas sp. P9_31]